MAWFLVESEGFERLHIRVLPRDGYMPQEQRGKRIFDSLDMPDERARTSGVTEFPCQGRSVRVRE